MKFKGEVFLTLCLLVSSQTFAIAKTSTIRWLIGNVKPQEIKQLCTEFQKEYPDIRVNPMVESWDTVSDKFITMTAAGQTIDVFCNNAVQGWARFARAGLFWDLTPLIQRDKISLDPGDFSPLVYEAYRYKGRYYSIPLQNFLAYSIAYNANRFAEAGLNYPTTDWNSKEWTWDDFVSYAKKLTKFNANGKVTQYGVDSWNVPIAISWANGGDFFDDASYKQNEVKKIVVDSKENVEAFTKWYELNKVHKVRGGGGIDVFRRGDIGMWLDPQSLQDPTQWKKNWKWGMTPFPMMKPGHRTNFAWTEVLAIPRASKNKEAAWTFIKWLSRKGLSPGITYPANSGRLSRWKNLTEWWPLDLSVNKKKDLQVFIEGGLKYARPMPDATVFGGQECMAAIGPYIDRAMEGQMGISQALSAAQKAAEAVQKRTVRSK